MKKGTYEKKWYIFKEKEREEKKKLHDLLSGLLSVLPPPTYASDNPIITKIFGGTLLPQRETLARRCREVSADLMKTTTGQTNKIFIPPR